jgi:protein-L-isoaspartate(D-aspartate) O-methyltransferase
MPDTTTSDTTGDTAAALRAAMVDDITHAGHARTLAVEQAMRTVARHAFVPAAPLHDAYADIAVITKRAADGAALSCASVPTIVAMMLDHLDARPGQRVLEIGAGTGYNAALLAHLVGPTGQVTTIDIDPDVTTHARHALDIAGHRTAGPHAVTVLTCDGALGDPDHAPYDRIIVTVGAWDLPTAWHRQLAPGGRLVVPLRWRGQTRCVAFVHDGDTLHAETTDLCGFVPMIGQDGERSAPIDPDGHVTLYWDTDQDIDPHTLDGVLNQPQHTAASGVTVGPYDPFDGIWLGLTATDPRTCRIAADPIAVQTGLCTPAIPSRTPALVEDASLAYLTTRRLDTPGRDAELGAIGHGPDGQLLAERLCHAIRTWNHDRTAQPDIVTVPTSTGSPTHEANRYVITKHDVKLLLAPSARQEDAYLRPEHRSR